MKTTPTLHTLCAAAAAALTLGLALPAQAQEFKPHPLYDVCDANRDGTVTRAEYLTAMGQMWDQKHAKMMKDAGAKMKAGQMTREQFTQFMRDLHPGLIGGN